MITDFFDVNGEQATIKENESGLYSWETDIFYGQDKHLTRHEAIASAIDYLTRYSKEFWFIIAPDYFELDTFETMVRARSYGEAVNKIKDVYGSSDYRLREVK